jgi:hypothetical protein
VKYRFSGKENRLSLGVYPETTLKAAREKRDELRRLIAAGVDPSAHRKQKKAGDTSADADSFEAVGGNG